MYENKYGDKITNLALILILGIFLFIFYWGNRYEWIWNIRKYRDYGYRVIDTQGQLVTGDRYHHSVDFNSKGITLVNELHAFIDADGNEVYEKATALIEDLSGGNWPEFNYYFDDEIYATTFFDDQGASVHIVNLESGDDYIVKNAKIATIAFDAYHFSEGLLAVYDLDTLKVGYIDKYGQWIIEPSFEEVYEFSDGLARVKENGLYGYIDHQGNYVIFPQFFDAEDFSEGYAAVAYEEDAYGFIDKQGNIVVKPEYRRVGSFGDGLALVFDSASAKYGYIDSKGNVVIDFKFASAQDFSYGLAAVQDSKTGKYGYIDNIGNFVISCQFTDAYSFTADGLARVGCDNDTSEYIDRDGKYLFKPQSIGLDDFENGYACIYLSEGQTIDYSDSERTEWKEEYNRKIKMQDIVLYFYEHNTKIVLVICSLWLICFLFYAIKYVREELHTNPKE